MRCASTASIMSTCRLRPSGCGRPFIQGNRKRGDPMSDDILAERDGPILRITLNRPDEGNAMSDPMAIELAQLLDNAAKTSRLVVLGRAGKDFCVGRASMGQRPATRPEALVWRRQSDVIFNCYAAFRRAPIPIVC